MDYEIFLFSRVREAYVETGDNSGAVALGLEKTGRSITCAALIVVIVTGGHPSGRNLLYLRGQVSFRVKL